MPHFVHVIETAYVPSFRTEKVLGMFDVPASELLRKSWDVNLPLESLNWNVGLIVGASGSGKTSIAKKAFSEDFFFEKHEWGPGSFLNYFKEDLEIKEIVEALSHVGFSSPPAWLLPYSSLSNGQKFRTDLARAILENNKTVVFDEFTSLVDRTVAKVSSHAVQKLVRKRNAKFVAVTCHYDVAEWLQPDWVFDVSTMSFSRGSLRRPSIKIQVQQVHHSVWKIFSGNHYLSADMNTSSKVFLATLEGQPAAMTAILSFPHPTLKNVWREHRTVVLPDYQGFGLGNALSEQVGDFLLAQGKRFRSVTSHPAMVHYRIKSKKWALVRAPSRLAHSSGAKKNTKNSSGRLTATFEYLGQK